MANRRMIRDEAMPPIFVSKSSHTTVVRDP